MPRKKKAEGTQETATATGTVVVSPMEEAKLKTTETPEEPKTSTKTAKPEKGYFFGYGRRKTATARARLYLPDQEVVVSGQKLNRGDVFVNNLPIEKYFPSPFAKSQYLEIYRTTNTSGRLITTVIVEGSGSSGQLGATLLAISRALCLVDPKFKVTLRKRGFMTRDPRAKERKKPGLMGARKQKSSPKR